MEIEGQKLRDTFTWNKNGKINKSMNSLLSVCCKRIISFLATSALHESDFFFITSPYVRNIL
jgi:hypothetical protein